MKPREILLLSIVGICLIISATGWFLSRGSDAYAAQSARQMQQWGIALNLYLIDNQNQLPETGITPVTAGQTLAWYNALPPYIGQTSLAKLPPGSRPKPGVESLWIVPGQKEPRAWDPEVFYFNYAMNQFLQPDPEARSFRIYEVDFPQNVVFLTEVDGYEPTCNPDLVDYRFGDDGQSPRAIANVLFCDGHVQPVSRAQLSDDPASRLAATAKAGVSWFEK
jgi:prepilin-type processing-associated H-X9-DG protein